MKVWNAGLELIDQLYNSKRIAINPNQVVDLMEDCAVFMLNKRQLRGMGLVQLKDDDVKENRYLEARENIYNWSKEKWADYEKHCEERGDQNKAFLKPHKEILKYKVAIDDYEKWDAEGRIIPENIKPVVEEKEKVYICPVCMKEFDSRIAFTGHNRSHQKENKEADDSTAVNHTSSGKS